MPRKLTKDYNFAALYPNIAKEWHPSKNGKLNPNDITPYSNKKVWWICERKHEWKTSIDKRSSRNQGCPICRSQTSRPELYIFSEFSTIFQKVEHRKKIDGMEVDIFIDDLNIGIEYDGSFFHKSKLKKDLSKRKKLMKKVHMINIREHPLESITKNDILWHRSNEYHPLVMKILENFLKSDFDLHKSEKSIKEYLNEASPRNEIFFNEMVSYLPGPLPSESLVAKFPKIAQEWHPTKNGELKPHNFSHGSTWKAWWLCKEGHEWNAAIANRTPSSSRKGNNCPSCNKYSSIVRVKNNLKSNFPKIAQEWHPTKNGELNPNLITKRSGKKVWWLCERSHEYQATVANRTRNISHSTKKNNCPYCIGQKVGFGNDLESMFPEISQEWHPTKNEKNLPSQFTYGSDKKVWWMCKKKHVWQAKITNRTGINKAGCPECNKGGVGNKKK